MKKLGYLGYAIQGAMDFYVVEISADGYVRVGSPVKWLAAYPLWVKTTPLYRHGLHAIALAIKTSCEESGV